MTTLLAVASLALVVFGICTLIVTRAVLIGPTHRPQPLANQEMLRMYDAIDKLESRVDKLTLAVSDGIERVHRAETRVAKTVTNARRLVRNAGLEHEGLEAEHEEIRARDDEGVEELPPMPTPVEETRTIRIPGGRLEIGAA